RILLEPPPPEVEGVVRIAQPFREPGRLTEHAPLFARFRLESVEPLEYREPLFSVLGANEERRQSARHVEERAFVHVRVLDDARVQLYRALAVAEGFAAYLAGVLEEPDADGTFRRHGRGADERFSVLSGGGG